MRNAFWGIGKGPRSAGEVSQAQIFLVVSCVEEKRREPATIHFATVSNTVDISVDSAAPRNRREQVNCHPDKIGNSPRTSSLLCPLLAYRLAEPSCPRVSMHGDHAILQEINAMLCSTAGFGVWVHRAIIH